MAERRCERGSGLLSTTIGLGCMIAMLGLSVNVLVGLWTRSTIDALAYDAARAVATAPPSVDRRRVAAAEFDRARSMMGPIGGEVRLELVDPDDADRVTVRVQAPGVSLLPAMISSGPVVAGLDRRITIRVEAP